MLPSHFGPAGRSTSIKVDIANQVRQTTVLAWRPLLPLFEAVMNSFQAINEAKLPADISGRNTIDVKREGKQKQLDLDTPPISGFRIVDNGIGLDDNNWDSFNTAFSAHKLTRSGKGLGRFTWLKAFDHVKIESIFKDDRGFHMRSFTFDESYDDDDERGLPKAATQRHAGTTIELVELKPLYIDQCPRATELSGKITDYEQYNKQFTKFLDEYNEPGVSALAQYVQHRRIILDFLECAINLPPDKKNYPLEKVVHRLVFPMQFTSEDIPSSEQNLWIIDERLTYHSFISSDKKNKSLSVLESDDKQRGDIVIFDEKIIFSDENRKGHPLSSIVVIEFKQPGRTKYREDENPVLQAARVINAIRTGKYRHKGRNLPIAGEDIPAMIFVVADLTGRLKEILIDFGATPTPDKQGFYGYHTNHKVYYEVMDYTKMLSDATKRNRIFFDKLNLVDNR